VRFLPRPTPSGRQPIILAVDDEPAIRALVRATLEPAGYRVVDAASASEALELASRWLDLVVLDVGLPDASGLEVCRRLKADPATAGVPVLFLTGLPLATERQEAYRLGAEGCIPKPFSPSELLSQIQAVLGQPASIFSR
jgi:two-component system alkaline phosphatase synthesis response regulator PhoP